MSRAESTCQVSLQHFLNTQQRRPGGASEGWNVLCDNQTRELEIKWSYDCPVFSDETLMFSIFLSKEIKYFYYLAVQITFLVKPVHFRVIHKLLVINAKRFLCLSSISISSHWIDVYLPVQAGTQYPREHPNPPADPYAYPYNKPTKPW